MLPSSSQEFVRTFSAVLLVLAALCATAGLARAQDDDAKPAKGISAGGKWMEYDSEDKMTAAKRVRFDLEADAPLRGSDAKPKVLIFCTNGKFSLGDFRPNVRMSPPNRPGFWGQPQMEVRTRVDDTPNHHGWNWVNGKFLAMDKGTVREMIGAKLFRIEFVSASGPQIAEFSPLGLDLSRVKNACGITPKRPEKPE